MVASGIYVKQVTVSDVEKRRLPSKHYVFVIEAFWSDGTRNIVYRRYSKFFSLQTELIERFPIEGGVKDPSCRILPFLPGKIIFGRSHIREVALKRKEHINEYCQNLVQLPTYVSRCEEVVHFFEPTPEDIEHLTGGGARAGESVKIVDSISEPVVLEQYVVLADYKKSRKNQVSVAEGDVVDLIEKHENGWWLVSFEDEQGWVPSSYLQPIQGGQEEAAPRHCTKEEAVDYICVKVFSTTEEDELSMEVGTVVEVSQKNTDGWWLLKANGKMGWAPRANLKRIPKNLVAASGKGAAGVQVADVRRGMEEKGKRMEPPPRRKSVKPKLKNKAKAGRPDFGKESDTTDGEYFTSAEIKAQLNKGTVTVEEGTSLQVIEKAPNGWWYVKFGAQEGWVPASEIQRRRKSVIEDIYENVAHLDLGNVGSESDPESHDYMDIEDFSDVRRTEVVQCLTLGAYVATDDNGISFEEGEEAEVLDRDPSGWWYVRIDDREGWAPSTFLERMHAPTKIKSTPFDKRGSNKISIAVPPVKPNRSRTPLNYENVTVGSESSGNVEFPDKPKQTTGKKSPVPARPPAPPRKAPESVQQRRSVSPSAMPTESFQVPRKVSSPPDLESVLKGKGSKESSEVSPVNVKRSASSKDSLGTQKKTVGAAAVSGMTSELDAVMKARRRMTEGSGTIESTTDNVSSGKIPPAVRPRPQPRKRPQSHHPGNVEIQHAAESVEQRERSASCATNSVTDGSTTSGNQKVQNVRARPVRPSPPTAPKKRPERPPLPPSTGFKEIAGDSYIAASNFTDSDEGMLNFREGETIVVTEKTEGGWWYAKRGIEEGWVPSNFLIKR